ELPTVENVNDARIGKFKQAITDTLAAGGLTLFQSLVEDYEREFNVPAVEIAAALAKMARGDVPLLMEVPKREPRPAPAFGDEREFNVPAVEIAAALAKMARGDVPLLMEVPKREPRPAPAFGDERGFRERPARGERPERGDRGDRPPFPKKERVARPPQAGMQ